MDFEDPRCVESMVPSTHIFVYWRPPARAITLKLHSDVDTSPAQAPLRLQEHLQATVYCVLLCILLVLCVQS